MRVSEVLLEGLIKLPPTLLRKLVHEVMSLSISYLRTRLVQVMDANDVEIGLRKAALKQFDEFFHSHYPSIKPKRISADPGKSHVKVVGQLKKSELPAAYQALLKKPVNYDFEFTPSGPLKVQLKFHDWEMEAQQARANYEQSERTINLNLRQIKSLNWLALVELIQDDEDTIDVRKKLEKALGRLLNRARDELIELEGFLEHELTHFLQFDLFGRANLKQIDGDVAGAKAAQRPTAGYLTQSIEFDPWIKLTLKSFQKYKNIIERSEKRTLDQKKFAEYMVGALADGQEKLKVADTTYFPRPFKFFVDLKKHDQTKWKKAVKYFMTALGDQK